MVGGCGAGAARVTMQDGVIASHGPAEHEQREKIDAISYLYRCPVCGFAENWQCRVREPGSAA